MNKCFWKKQGNEHTCKSAIYTNQNEKLIQQKCTIEYYPKLDPDPDILDAGNYILLGNFPLPWNYFCKQKDEILNSNFRKFLCDHKET